MNFKNYQLLYRIVSKKVKGAYGLEVTMTSFRNGAKWHPVSLKGDKSSFDSGPHPLILIQWILWYLDCISVRLINPGLQE